VKKSSKFPVGFLCRLGKISETAASDISETSLEVRIRGPPDGQKSEIRKTGEGEKLKKIMTLYPVETGTGVIFGA
jgi:hypothetical protein